MENGSDEDISRQLQETLDSDPNNYSHHYNLAVFFWENGEKRKEWRDKAAEHLVLCVKLDPNNGDAFRLLGHYYSHVSVDVQRAAKCYQRAVYISPEDSEAGEALCELLDEGGKEILEVIVCQEASKKSPRAFWAWRRLGYLQVHQKKWMDAAQSLQHAVRGYPTCADLWEALGLAYQRLGMFTAAVKSYGRAIELEGGSRVFSLIESGNVLSLLGSFRKGVEQFRLALVIAPENLAAHYGLASALLGMSKECVNSGAFKWGASLLEEASDIVRGCLHLAGNISSMWKLYGDIQFAYAKCHPWAIEMKCTEINEESFTASVLSWKKKCCSAARCAKRLYQKALHLAPWEANLSSDVAISQDLFCSWEEEIALDEHDLQLAEKMSLGALMIEGNNDEFWVKLGCSSKNKALQQHALIRALQLDISNATAWAYLGKLYKKHGHNLLAKQAFDRARSIDPSLALPWAGMSTYVHDGECSPDEAYESCLRAVQTLPVAEFQMALGQLALLSGHLHSSAVYAAAKHAVQRAPHSPEAHNLHGLVSEARKDYHSAIDAYKMAMYCINSFAKTASQSDYSDIRVNLARSLCKAGHVLDAIHECGILQSEGLLDCMGLQVYAVTLYRLGKNDEALLVTKKLVEMVSSMNWTSGAATLALVCKLLYHISGQETAAAMVLSSPRELLQNSKLSTVACLVTVLDLSGVHRLFFQSSFQKLFSHEDAPILHSLLAKGIQISHGTDLNLGIKNASLYLRRVLHMYPDSNLIRNQLAFLLLSSRGPTASHTAIRCIDMDPHAQPVAKGSKSAFEILGSAAVSCYDCCTSKSKLSFQTCKHKFGTSSIQQLQRWLHRYPWNRKARYFLILNLFQKAREERYPRHLCDNLGRQLTVALNDQGNHVEIYSSYQKFQLLLCASEISLQIGASSDSKAYATSALGIPVPNSVLFFGHLQLGRIHAASGNMAGLREECSQCLQLGTNFEIGWISLKMIGTRYKLQISMDEIDAYFEACLKEKDENSQSMWRAIIALVDGQGFILDNDLDKAEQALAHACSIWDEDSCLHLVHGAICLELARQRSGSQFLSQASESLSKAQENSDSRLPFVSALLAQAEASLGAKAKWERNLQLEWMSWPPGYTGNASSVLNGGWWRLSLASAMDIHVGLGVIIRLVTCLFWVWSCLLGLLGLQVRSGSTWPGPYLVWF
ncbi:tetratricopeptide repeat protein SKI3 isoform X1 [Amborella trichopoda]|uniref:tetratricopeptide repeat protein SKI3 isoform X1 n=2 Tax=Amborella trichopoda TaxID=13333 RepID=UPI0009BD8505|nr:tetratricopeptide repeat protein SKI3 isoform X1 [Amborella trichopoda]|eukprot:XP_020526306.1 tetratricopeptide repeat protein SKI3 isoform X1 [Amborella trichopoda]